MKGRDLYEKLPGSYYNRDNLTTGFKIYKDFFDSCFKVSSKGINLGCGRGTSCKELSNCLGVDFNRSLLPIWKVHQVPAILIENWVPVYLLISYQNFDYCLSFDFMEHLEDEAEALELVATLRAHVKIGRHIIDLKKRSGYRGPNGENLHAGASFDWAEIARKTDINFEVIGQHAKFWWG